jgi:sarcosine oxidase subunit delta
VSEYTYVGDAARTRPALDAPQEEWCAYLFERQNPMGWHLEYWQHTAGCRAVLTVERNTLTHEIRATRIAGAWSVPARARAQEPAE